MRFPNHVSALHIICWWPLRPAYSLRYVQCNSVACAGEGERIEQKLKSAASPAVDLFNFVSFKASSSTNIYK